MILQVLLSLVVVVLVVTFLAWPLIKGVDERVVDAERRELEDAKQAKYREIKDAELDHKSGRMTEEQWRETDAELRREAMLILREIDTLGAKRATSSATADQAG